MQESAINTDGRETLKDKTEKKITVEDLDFNGKTE